jgi:type I restriction enzyme S subunit
MKRYNKYKPSGVEWIGEVPEHWDMKKIKYSDEIIMGQSPSSDDYSYAENGFPFIQGNAEFSELHPKPKLWCSSANKIALIDDILLSVRAPIGAVNIANQKIGIGRGLCLIRPKFHHKKYLYYFILFSTDELNSIGTGSTYTAVSAEEVKNLFILNPSADEQTFIANYLDEKTAQIDSLIGNKEKLIELLKEERTAVINHYVLGQHLLIDNGQLSIFNCQLPKHWEVKKLKYVAKVQSSNVDKKINKGENPIHLCNYMDVYKNEFINVFFNFMEATATEREIEKFILMKEDVLITKDSETPDDIANPAFVTQDFKNVICGYHLAQIRTNKNKLLGEFLFRLFQSKQLNAHFEISANGVTRFGLPLDSITDVEVVFPAIMEQIQIIQHIETETKRIDSTISKIEKEIELLQEYRTALISEVVTGKIKVMNN